MNKPNLLKNTSALRSSPALIWYSERRNCLLQDPKAEILRERSENPSRRNDVTASGVQED